MQVCVLPRGHISDKVLLDYHFGGTNGTIGKIQTDDVHGD